MAYSGERSLDVSNLKTEQHLSRFKMYQIEQMALDQDLGSVLSAWKKLNEQFPEDNSIVTDPEWLQARAKIEKADIGLYLLSVDDEIAGVVPLEFNPHRVNLRLGDFIIAKVPIARCRMLAQVPSLPPETVAHDLLFEHLLKARFDGMYVTGVRADSFFWNYLHNSTLIQRNFVFYSQHGLRPHPIIRINGSFQEYLKGLSRSTRENFTRKLRKLRETGTVELVKITDATGVDPFLSAATEISRKTYQFRMLGMGIRDPEQLRQWLKWAAERGWLRSYLLTCGGKPVAFQIAYQCGENFLGQEIGYDPDWSKLSVGIIQQLLALEEIFKENPPRICEFGGYADYKQMLANDSFSRANVWLFRRKAYPTIVFNAYRLFCSASALSGDLLHSLDLKAKVKGFLRRKR